jgi:hypothetical protein
MFQKSWNLDLEKVFRQTIKSKTRKRLSLNSLAYQSLAGWKYPKEHFYLCAYFP